MPTADTFKYTDVRMRLTMFLLTLIDPSLKTVITLDLAGGGRLSSITTGGGARLSSSTTGGVGSGLGFGFVFPKAPDGVRGGSSAALRSNFSGNASFFLAAVDDLAALDELEELEEFVELELREDELDDAVDSAFSG
ncbi:MAG: hypothetical protein AAF585_24660 [Verrucomicrobiota bacterium]